MNPKGHAALVTGGASGLGEGTAIKLAAAGCKVTILDMNMDLARAVAAKIGGHAEHCDVSDEASTIAAIKGARDKHGVARILVNCAGIGGAMRIVGKEGPMPLAHFEKVIKVNLVGTFNATRLFAADLQTIEPLEAGERGVVIMTASVAAFEGQIGQAAYASSKGGVRALILPAAREFAQFGIRVMGIAPGIFKTPMMAGMREDVQKSLAESIPFPKLLGTPEEYAMLALQIVENRYLNGDLIRLDGAIRMAPR
jgi:NAD(P)-dependent dehydrogenase (short-subunit alcohol dehydrogenase family)